jgi:hypothetical protein
MQIKRRAIFCATSFEKTSVKPLGKDMIEEMHIVGNASLPLYAILKLIRIDSIYKKLYIQIVFANLSLIKSGGI